MPRWLEIEGWDCVVSIVVLEPLNGKGSTCVGLQSVINRCPPPVVEVITVEVADSKGEGENRTRFPPPPPDAEETKPESDLKLT